MRKNTVTSKNRPPQNLTRFSKSRPKYAQTWHHVLKRPQPCINQIKYLHSQQPFYCSSWVKVYRAATEDLAELAKKLPEGRLYGNGRGFVPNVRQSLYSDIIVTLAVEPQAAV